MPEEDDNVLSEEERQWVRELHKAAQREGIQVEHKFSLAAFALVAKGDVKKALVRMKNWNRIQEKYRLSETSVEEVKAQVETVFQDVLLGIGVTRSGMAGLGVNLAPFNPSLLTAEQESKVYVKLATMTFLGGMAATYYVDGISMRNFSVGHEQRNAALYQDAAPIKLKQIILVDPPYIIHGILKLLGLFLKKKVMDRIAVTSRDKLVEHFDASQLPPFLGGSFCDSPSEVRDRGYARYLQSVRQVEQTLQLD